MASVVSLICFLLLIMYVDYNLSSEEGKQEVQEIRTLLLHRIKHKIKYIIKVAKARV